MRFIPNLLVGTMILIAVMAVSAPEVEGAGASPIIINEIMYDPAITEVQGEWVELYNTGNLPVNISNWSLLDQDGDDLAIGDVDFMFPDIYFPAHGYALIHTGQGQNSTSFINGKAEFYMWRSSGAWTNTGDDVLLANETGATMDFFSYGPWDGSSVDEPPVDFTYDHSNASSEEDFSLALTDGQFRESVPTPLEINGLDVVPELLITEVYYDTWGENEYVKIFNPGLMAINISNWQLTDDEGIAIFPSGTEISPGQTITIAQNSTNFIATVLEIPDFEYWEEDASIPNMGIIYNEPKLVNDNDEVFLLNIFGTQIDAFVYGDSDYVGIGWDGPAAPDQKQGKIAKRAYNGTYADTNTSADWLSLHPYVLGQSDFQSTTFSGVGPTWLFSSPDSSFDVVCEALDNATQYIQLNLYEFTNTQLCDRLLAAIGRGVSVSLFLEGSPVGGMNETQLYIARQIVDAGGLVRILTSDSDNDIHVRYNYNHGKYAVIDDNILIMMSENWGWTGVPPTGWDGNRGWGAVLSDPDLAAYFKEVFEHDWNPLSPDSVAFDASHVKWNSGHNWSKDGSECEMHFEREYIVSSSLVTPVLSPDTSLSSQTILGMLSSAQDRVYVEEFYIYKHWGDRNDGSTTETPNLYLEAVIDAARRGCEVRVLMDASYYNVEPDDPIDNDDTAEYINVIALAEDLDMEGKVINQAEHDFTKIHNKGMIVDNKVLISSINWNHNSVTENRETGIIIDNVQAAEFFTEIFDYDWKDDMTPPYAHFSYEPSYRVNTTVQFSSNASFDNVGIVNYTWSLDGQPISWDVNLTHNFTKAGFCILNLTIEDDWSNMAWVEHTLNITVAETISIDDAENDPNNNNETSDPSTEDYSKTIAVLLLVPVFIFIAVVYIMYIRNR